MLLRNLEVALAAARAGMQIVATRRDAAGPCALTRVLVFTSSFSIVGSLKSKAAFWLPCTKQIQVCE